MDGNEKPKTVKIGLEITVDLDAEINDAFKKYGYQDRAEFVRDAIREKIDRWKKENPEKG